MAQNNQANTVSDANTVNKTDYSLYGDDFSKEFIDEMLNDKRFWNAMNYRLQKNEGEYVDHPNDHGGETKFGISKNTYQNENIKNLTRERANALSHRDFWLWNGIYKLPDDVVSQVFDYGFLTQPLNAIRTTHRVLGIQPEGNIIGPETLKRIKEMSSKEFIDKFKQEGLNYVRNIVKRDKSQEVFLEGWENRIKAY